MRSDLLDLINAPLNHDPMAGKVDGDAFAYRVEVLKRGPESGTLPVHPHYVVPYDAEHFPVAAARFTHYEYPKGYSGALIRYRDAAGNLMEWVSTRYLQFVRDIEASDGEFYAVRVDATNGDLIEVFSSKGRVSSLTARRRWMAELERQQDNYPILGDRLQAEWGETQVRTPAAVAEVKPEADRVILPDEPQHTLQQLPASELKKRARQDLNGQRARLLELALAATKVTGKQAKPSGRLRKVVSWVVEDPSFTMLYLLLTHRRAVNRQGATRSEVESSLLGKMRDANREHALEAGLEVVTERLDYRHATFEVLGPEQVRLGLVVWLLGVPYKVNGYVHMTPFGAAKVRVTADSGASTQALRQLVLQDLLKLI